MKVKVTFTEELLGTLAGSKEVAKEFILSKGNKPDEDEVLEPMEELTNSTTIFPKIDGKPFLWDYQIKGFFKEACKAMLDMGIFTKEELKKDNLTNYTYKRTLDNQLFITPRKVFLNLSGELTYCERPLRADTPRGERIALARSEAAPEGTTIEFEIITMNKGLDKFLTKWLDYGVLKGMGQWRNSGKGRFEWNKA